MPGVPATASCLSIFEREFPCGIIDRLDYSDDDESEPDFSFDEQMTGPGQGCGEGMMGGEGWGESMAALGGDAPSSGEESSGGASNEAVQNLPPAPTWTLMEFPVVVELRAVGESVPLTVLASGTTYEIHYAGAAQPIQGYLIKGSGLCSPGCIASASPATAGIWSETGLFEYLPPDAETLAHDLILDDRPTTVMAATGFLCRITAGAPGDLTLDLRMGWSDSEASITYQMVGQVTVLVGAP